MTGLYSRSLYRYDEAFVKRIGAAIEMEGHLSILIINESRLLSTCFGVASAVFLVDNPQYHTLFGSVSVSREYSDLARSLIADTLLMNESERIYRIGKTFDSA